MRINRERKSVDIEERDIEFMLATYVRNYMFYSENEEPEKIIFPMFKSIVKSVNPEVRIPIEFVPIEGEVAQEIAEDGKDIPLATEAEIAAKDAAEADLTPASEGTVLQPLVSEADAPSVVRLSIEEAMGTKKVSTDTGTPNVTTPDRRPKAPDHPAPEGTLSDMGPRDRRDQTRVAKDIAPQADVDEEKERPTEIEKPEEQQDVET